MKYKKCPPIRTATPGNNRNPDLSDSTRLLAFSAYDLHMRKFSGICTLAVGACARLLPVSKQLQDRNLNTNKYKKNMLRLN